MFSGLWLVGTRLLRGIEEQVWANGTAKNPYLGSRAEEGRLDSPRGVAIFPGRNESSNPH